MSNRTWYGGARLVAQVDNFTPANIEATDVFTLTQFGKTVSVTAAGTSLGDLLDALVLAWNNSAYPEMAQLTATENGSAFYLTADTPGRPFTVTSSATDGGGANTQTFVRASITASSGPNDYGVADNWSGTAVPVNGDTIVFDGQISNSSVLYTLDQSAVTAAGISVINDYTGLIGLPEKITADVREWLETDLTIACTGLTVIANSGRLKFDLLTSSAAVLIESTGSPEASGVPALSLACGSGPTSVTVETGSVGLGIRTGQTAVVPIINQTGGEIECGSGATLTNVNKFGGTLTIRSNTTTIIHRGGSLYLEGASTHAAITNYNQGVVYYDSSGTCTAYTGNDTSTISFDGRFVARTLTNGTLNDSAQLIDTNRTVTHSNALAVVGQVGGRVRCGRTYNVTPT